MTVVDEDSSSPFSKWQAVLLVAVATAGFLYLRLGRNEEEGKSESPEEIRRRRAVFLAETTTTTTTTTLEARLGTQPQRTRRHLQTNSNLVEEADGAVSPKDQSSILEEISQTDPASEKKPAYSEDPTSAGEDRASSEPSTTTATPPPTQEMKVAGENMTPKKKKAKTLPPVQQLCESLSEALSFTVQPTAGGRWDATEGWRKRLKQPMDPTNRPLLLLDLSASAPPISDADDDEEQREWSDLHHAMSHMASIPAYPQSFSLRVGWAAKAFGNFRIQSQKHPRGSACFRIAEQWVLHWIRVAMEAEMAQTTVDDDDDDLPDLFRDETPDPSTFLQVKTMVDDLLNLVETSAVVHMNGLFLEGLWGGAVEGAGQSPLLDRVYSRMWQRLEETWKNNDASLLRGRINAVSHVLSQSKRVRGLVAKDFTAADVSATATGKEIEEQLPVTRLWSIAAYTLPVTIDEADRPSLFVHQMEKSLLDGDVPENLGVAFFRNQTSLSFNACSKDTRALMQTARNVCQVLLKQIMKDTDKSKVFNWLARLVQTNEALTGMMTGDLLSSEGIAALSSSWPFLLGVGSSTLNLCVNNLAKRFVEKGSAAFDLRYMATNRLGLDNANAAPLSPNDSLSQTDVSSKSIRFDGASQFFFVTAGLLHCSLYPLLRVEGSFHQKYNQVLGMLQDMQNQPGTHVPPHLRSASRVAVVGWMGFSFFLEDPAFVADMTKFALLQLRWLLDLARTGTGLHSVPDWFCKEPSRWLAHVAATTTGVITPAQADEAVGVITELLTIGSEEKSMNAKALSFSPVVLTELVRVASSFVQAGVRRSRRGQRKHQNTEADLDDPALYLSFDKNDLGVAVFANDRVCRELCPTLLKAFRAMDVVEGLNVDVEANFDKYSVKLEISSLLTILWGLPNGRCKASILHLPSEELASFVTSLAAAITFLLDDAIQRYTDACRLRKQIRRTPQDNAFMERQSQGATSNFCSARKLLLLLWKVSEKNSPMSRAIGTHQGAATAVGSMVIHFLELLTSPDGQTNTDLDPVVESERSAAISASVDRLDDKSLRDMVSKLVNSRRTLVRDFGLNISIFAHQLLALVFVWDEAADKSSSVCSAVLDAMALHEDCDTARYKAIIERLVPGNDQDAKDAVQLVLLRDGYVGSDVWAETQEQSAEITTKQRQREATSCKAQISHDKISVSAPKAALVKLLAKLEGNIATRTTAAGGASPIDILGATRELLSETATISEDMFTELTRGWKISSESLADISNNGKFVHYFDKNARSHGSIPGSGRALLEEAKKCKRGIPEPHPNASIFLCIGEERMDLVRAAMTGPTDTPYSMGLFVFDVFFPPSYPQIPPLVQFMTTGGGQVRFGPNLYQDGKVCLSLLGTFHAQDESQQWNPKRSSLAQVLLSIQTQLLSSDPYFNEPGHEGMAHTRAGMEASRRYNLSRRLDTLRHAILAPLTHPPLGFADVVQQYFSQCRLRILVQAKRWVLEAKGSSLEARYKKVMSQLVTQLQKVAPLAHPLAPREEDVVYLQAHDPGFCSLIPLSGTKDLEDNKPTAVGRADSQELPRPALFVSGASSQFNPWLSTSASGTTPNTDIGDVPSSNPWASQNTSLPPSGLPKTDDDDGDDFYS